MKNKIINNLNNPSQLEKLYRENKASFKKEFNQLYPEYQNLLVLQYWNERLNFETEKKTFGSKKELLFVLVIALLAGIVANIPNITGINEERFFSKNIAFIVFPFLSFYYITSQKSEIAKLLKRNYIGIEIQEEYCKISEKQLTNNKKSLFDF